MEVISRIAGGDNPLIAASSTVPKTAADIAITYLTDSYSRVAVEERNHPKVRCVPVSINVHTSSFIFNLLILI